MKIGGNQNVCHQVVENLISLKKHMGVGKADLWPPCR